MLTRRLATVLSFVLVAAAAQAEPAPPRDDADVSFDGMQRVKSERFALVWVHPDAHFAVYKKLLVLPAEIAYKRPPSKSPRADDNFALDAVQTKRLRKALRDAFREQVVEKGGWEVVEQPGPDVMLARGALIDMVVHIPPPTAGRSRIFVQSFGEATLVIELYDSQTHQILARIADRAAAEPPGSRMGSDMEAPAEVRRMFGAWAKRFREGLELARTRKP